MSCLEKPRRAISFAINLGLAIGSTLLVLILAELLVRGLSLATPSPSATALWNPRREQLHITPRSQVGGFSFREARLDDAIFSRDCIRVLFLGDSFTYGAGVRSQDRFTDIVEARLNAELTSAGIEKSVHVFNAGVGSTEPDEWIQYFRAIQPVY